VDPPPPQAAVGGRGAVPAALAARARRWVATYIAAATQGTAPVPASPASSWRSSSLHSPHTHPRERDEEV